MSDYRRWYVPGCTYFFTVVTYDRVPVFRSPSAIAILGNVIRDVRMELPFTTIAAVLLPDHLHVLWSLPRGDDDYSTRWQRIKREFTCRYLAMGGLSAEVTASQRAHGNKGVWQRRFWEHTIRDEEEIRDFCDYIHFNPVKHHYARRAGDWPHSTFHRFVALGEYEETWGRSVPESIASLNYE